MCGRRYKNLATGNTAVVQHINLTYWCVRVYYDHMGIYEDVPTEKFYEYFELVK